MFDRDSARLKAVQTARQVLETKPVFLDTETTGLARTDEVIEIAIVDADGQTLCDSFVRPSRPIPADATRINHITNEMVQGSQTWPILWTQKVRSVLVGKVIVAYNADFDKAMLQQSHDRYRLPWRENLQWFDLLKLYSQFRGLWDASRGNWKFISLDEAGKTAGITIPNAHRALADTLLARELMLHIAKAN
jgi:DNA polymerase-3 subunit epsilon